MCNKITGELTIGEDFPCVLSQSRFKIDSFKFILTSFLQLIILSISSRTLKQDRIAISDVTSHSILGLSNCS